MHPALSSINRRKFTVIYGHTDFLTKRLLSANSGHSGTPHISGYQKWRKDYISKNRDTFGNPLDVPCYVLLPNRANINQIGTTLFAHGPFWPWPVSNSTAWPSLRVAKPPELWISE
jgi:hypothetical protein